MVDHTKGVIKELNFLQSLFLVEVEETFREAPRKLRKRMKQLQRI